MAKFTSHYESRKIHFCAVGGVFTAGNSPKRYPEKIRRIKYRDVEQGRVFLFLTNDFESSAQTIADLYHKRWAIELFFKMDKATSKG